MYFFLCVWCTKKIISHIRSTLHAVVRTKKRWIFHAFKNEMYKSIKYWQYVINLLTVTVARCGCWVMHLFVYFKIMFNHFTMTNAIFFWVTCFFCYVFVCFLFFFWPMGWSWKILTFAFVFSTQSLSIHHMKVMLVRYTHSFG